MVEASHSPPPWQLYNNGGRNAANPFAQVLDRAGDATGYACATHDNFKVADTVFAERRVKDYNREQWEAALYKAEQRTRPGEWPVVRSSDF
jgi:hypothetical protein